MAAGFPLRALAAQNGVVFADPHGRIVAIPPMRPRLSRIRIEAREDRLPADAVVRVAVEVRGFGRGLIERRRSCLKQAQPHMLPLMMR